MSRLSSNRFMRVYDHGGVRNFAETPDIDQGNHSAPTVPRSTPNESRRQLFKI
jgi:hypothetical protein